MSHPWRRSPPAQMGCKGSDSNPSVTSPTLVCFSLASPEEFPAALCLGLLETSCIGPSHFKEMDELSDCGLLPNRPKLGLEAGMASNFVEEKSPEQDVLERNPQSPLPGSPIPPSENLVTQTTPCLVAGWFTPKGLKVYSCRRPQLRPKPTEPPTMLKDGPTLCLL
jgi:hypothetical protein